MNLSLKKVKLKGSFILISRLPDDLNSVQSALCGASDCERAVTLDPLCKLWSWRVCSKWIFTFWMYTVWCLSARCDCNRDLWEIVGFHERNWNERDVSMKASLSFTDCWQQNNWQHQRLCVTYCICTYTFIWVMEKIRVWRRRNISLLTFRKLRIKFKLHSCLILCIFEV